MVNRIRVTKNPNSYTVCGFSDKTLVWCENETQIKSVLSYGISEEDLPQKVWESKFYEWSEKDE